MTARRVAKPSTLKGAGSEAPEAVTRSEEELRTAAVTKRSGVVRVRKRVEERPEAQVLPRSVEQVEMERMEVSEADSGEVETLPDGSISIPVFEERLVVEKQLVVRERIVIRKVKVTEEREVKATLRRERVEIDADPEVASRVQEVAPAQKPLRATARAKKGSPRAKP